MSASTSHADRLTPCAADDRRTLPTHTWSWHAAAAQHRLSSARAAVGTVGRFHGEAVGEVAAARVVGTASASNSSGSAATQHRLGAASSAKHIWISRLVAALMRAIHWKRPPMSSRTCTGGAVRSRLQRCVLPDSAPEATSSLQARLDDVSVRPAQTPNDVGHGELVAKQLVEVVQRRSY